MSVHFAIPATTFVLKSIIEARLKAAYGAFTPPKVLVEPPPRQPPSPPGNGAEATGLILFMHHAGPNTAWRNMFEPHVDSSTGKRIARAPLVLDLYYMLATQGLDLEREVLLGVGMSALHRNAIVPRPMIQQILGAIAIPNPPAKLMDSLTAEPLADPNNQPESITVTQQTVDIDLSTKLWTALHSPIRPCAYYLVTTVFLDPGETFPDPTPVDHLVVAERPVVDPGPVRADDDVATVVAP
jgi:hypothetical protein